MTVVERSGAHALCCARGESTRGHYACRDALLNFVHIADASATTEEPDLIPSRPALRPADIFTSAALPGGRAALDVGVCCPDAQGAGDDCCAAMEEAKRARYGPFLHELAAQGIRYVPFVASCYGRLHPEADLAMERIGRQAARRLGVRDPQPLVRRPRAALGVAIRRRAAAMVTACIPPLDDEALQILFGEAGAAGSE